MLGWYRRWRERRAEERRNSPQGRAQAQFEESRRRASPPAEDDGFTTALLTGVPVPATPMSMLGMQMHHARHWTPPPGPAGGEHASSGWSGASGGSSSSSSYDGGSSGGDSGSSSSSSD